RAVVQMDMIGSLNAPTPTVLLEGAALSQAVIDGLRAAAATYTRLAVQVSLNPFNSDHVSFIRQGMPAVLTIEGTDDANHAIRTGYCSDARRTRRTLEPLGAEIGAAFELVEVPTEDPGGIERHIETVVSAIRALPADAVAAVVGHTNTIPQIIEGLGGGLDGTAIGETEFDRLFVLSRAPGGFVALVKLR